jgi:hypothetical protein
VSHLWPLDRSGTRTPPKVNRGKKAAYTHGRNPLRRYRGHLWRAHDVAPVGQIRPPAPHRPLTCAFAFQAAFGAHSQCHESKRQRRPRRAPPFAHEQAWSAGRSNASCATLPTGRARVRVRVSG